MLDMIIYHQSTQLLEELRNSRQHMREFLGFEQLADYHLGSSRRNEQLENHDRNIPRTLQELG